MGIYPNAVWRPLPENETEPVIAPRVVILHTAVSGAASLFDFYNRPGVNLESQFYVSQDAVEQYVDTTRQADANLKANGWAVSIETWDNRDPANTQWTPKQMDLLVGLVAWCCDTHGIPARQCPAWDAAGIGWHVMFGAPGPWTPVNKSCPGGPRIAQMPELIARVAAALSPPPAAPEPVKEIPEMVIYTTNDSAYYLFTGQALVYLPTSEDTIEHVEKGVPSVHVSQQYFDLLTRQYGILAP